MLYHLSLYLNRCTGNSLEWICWYGIARSRILLGVCACFILSMRIIVIQNYLPAIQKRSPSKRLLTMKLISGPFWSMRISLLRAGLKLSGGCDKNKRLQTIPYFVFYSKRPWTTMYNVVVWENRLWPGIRETSVWSQTLILLPKWCQKKKDPSEYPIFSFSIVGITNILTR